MPALIIAWLVNPANWLKLALGVVIAGLLALAGVQTLRLQHSQADLAASRAQTVVATDQATVASGQALADQSAAGVEAARLAAAAAADQIHVENQHAIAAAPGASQALDPALNAAGRLSLCRDAEYAGDPQCAGLLKGHPAVLSSAGGAHAAP